MRISGSASSNSFGAQPDPILSTSNGSKFGTIENSFKQSDIAKAVFDNYGIRNDVTDSGVCMSMAAFYLIKQSQGTDFFSWLSEKEQKWEVLSQYLGDDYRPLPPIAAQKAIQDMIEDAGLKQEGQYTVGPKDYCSDTVADAMSTSVMDTCPARMCYFHAENKPGHAAALLVEKSGALRLLDPNFGEVSFHSQTEFENWMSDVFKKHYGIHSNLTVSYYRQPQDASPATA